MLIKNKLNIIKEIIFPDHYNYTQNDIDHIKLQAKKFNAQILTTEKDYVKINSNKNDNIKFLKIELTIKDEEKLINYLKFHI
jgi:tetraacyldisaccharide 4'-kinase